MRRELCQLSAARGPVPQLAHHCSTVPLFPLPITAHPHLGTHRVSTNHCSIKQPSSSSFSSYVVPIYTCNQKQSNPSLVSNGRCPTFIILSADIPFSQISFHPQDSSINQSCYSLPLPPPSLHSICILKPRIHDSYSGSPQLKNTSSTRCFQGTKDHV